MNNLIRPKTINDSTVVKATKPFAITIFAFIIAAIGVFSHYHLSGEDAGSIIIIGFIGDFIRERLK